MKAISIIIITIIFLCFAGNAFAQDFYPTTIASLTSEVTLHGSGTISGLKEGENVKFQTLTFQESSFQNVNILKEELYINGKTISPEHSLDEFDNKYVTFTIPYNGNFEYELSAQVQTSSLVYKMTDYNITSDFPDNIKIFLNKSEKVESNSNEIRTIVQSKFPNNSFLETLNDTVFWVNDYVEYTSENDFQKYYLLQRSAIETLIDKKGVCDEFANLGAAILRAKGIPTKLAIGITFDGKSWGNHAWLNVFHKDFGWIPSDPTFRESGFVDATHIQIGSFEDVSQSLAKASFPSTTNVNFQTQTIPDVKIINTEYFNEVTISTDSSELKTNQWNIVPIKIKNNTNSTVTAPIAIKESYNEIFFDEKTKAVILEPHQEKVVEFKIYPNISLDPTQIAKGTITFHSLDAPYSKEFTISPAPKKDNGEVIVKDITPITTQETMQVEIKIANYSTADSKVKITISTTDTNNNWEETIPAFYEETIEKEVSFKETLYTVKVETQNQIYTQLISPSQQKIDIIEIPHETVVVQKINTENKLNTIQSLIERPEIIVFALMPAIAIVLLGLFAVKKRYV